ncbi:MAG: sulfatase-like hydrolase/transferase [Elusimicrobia bacterium]|nr:sulfatase-like hydrolase/transferase [Candidatus Liberimonas magnetica]
MDIFNIFILFIVLFFANPLFLLAKSGKNPPDVIIISLDTLRMDHVGCFGYKKNITPNIDKFARDAVMFKNAFAPSPNTLSSHKSLFTSLYTRTHGYEDDKDFDLKARKAPLHITNELKSKGYYTAAVISCWHLDSEFGFSAGFDFFKRIKENNLVYADKVNSDASQLLKILDNPEQNLFLFFHYYDIHSDYTYDGNILPYYSPFEYMNTFVPKDLREKYSGLYKDKPATDYLLYYSYEAKSKPPKEEIEYLIDLYDSGIACTDHYIGELFSLLKEHNLYDNSLIVLVSDHGEEFGEHGEFIHNQVYDECSRIPLLIKFPKNKFAGTKRDALVEIIDIMPTVLGCCGLDIPQNLQGKSLMPLIKGRDQFKDEVYLKQHLGNNIFAVRTKQYKLIYDTKTLKLKLFDMAKDPLETTDITAEHYDVARELIKKLFTWMDACDNLSKNLPVQNVEQQ